MPQKVKGPWGHVSLMRYRPCSVSWCKHRCMSMFDTDALRRTASQPITIRNSIESLVVPQIIGRLQTTIQAVSALRDPLVADESYGSGPRWRNLPRLDTRNIPRLKLGRHKWLKLHLQGLSIVAIVCKSSIAPTSPTLSVWRCTTMLTFIVVLGNVRRAARPWRSCLRTRTKW